MATRDQPAAVPRVRGAGSSPRRRLRRALAVAMVAATALVGVAPATAQEPGSGGGTPPGSSPGSTPPGTALPGDPGAASTARDLAVQDCLEPDRPREVAGPWPDAPYLARIESLDPATVIDSRGSIIDNTTLNRAGFGIGVRIRRVRVGEGVCFLGGSIRTDLEPEETPWATWHRVTAMGIEAPDFRVVGTAFRNQGDLMAFSGDADDWKVIGVRAEGGSEHPGAYAHDDCVENDSMLSGSIEDSKFDGCFAFLSSTQASEHTLDGTGEEVAVRSSLVRLQPYRNSFNVPKYGEGGHGGFFKWASTQSTVMIPPALSVSDSMFRADDPARYGGNEGGFLGLPPGTRCERVVLIGTETWPAKDLTSWQEQCDDLRLGTIADWDAAVAAWDAAHPPLRDLAGTGRDAASSVLGW